MGGHLNGVVHENKNVDVMGVHVIENDDLCFNKIADSRIKRWCTKKTLTRNSSSASRECFGRAFGRALTRWVARRHQRFSR